MYALAAIVVLCFTSGISAQYNKLTEFQLLKVNRIMSSNDTLKQASDKNAEWLNHVSKPMPVEFTCHVEKSRQVPTSAHKLRPSDIKVVSAMGDSVTAGHGILAKNLIGVLLQDRGHSWSIGGKGNLERIVTLPNILKKFNPKLTGFSTATSMRFMWEAGMNVAEAGHTAEELPGQADMLIESLKEDSNINFNTDWKLLTLFIGGNDLCKYCLDRNAKSPENYIKNIQTALDKILAAVPRMLVNIVPIFDVSPIPKMSRGLACDLLQDWFCSCGTDPELAKELPIIQRQYYEGLVGLVDSGRYDTKEDFTVVLQPFTRDQKPPRKPDNSYDRSVFSHDCFHPNRKAHTALAVALWDTMLTPVGKKPFTADEIVEPKLKCPTKEHPYIFTRKNSGLNIVSEAVDHQLQAMPGSPPSALPGCANCGKGEIDSMAALTLLIMGAVVVILIAGVVLGVVIPRYRKRKATKENTSAVTSSQESTTAHDNKAFSEQSCHV